MCNEYVHLFSAPFVEFSKPLHDVEVMEKESAKFECEVSRESAKVFTTEICVEFKRLMKPKYFKDSKDFFLF